MSFVSILMKNDRVIKGFYCIIFTKRSYQCLHRKVSSKLSDILGLLNIEEEIIDVYETENKYFIPFISRNNDFC